MSTNKKTRPGLISTSARSGHSNKMGATPVSQTWEVSVSRGRELVTTIGRCQWELGDLANEVCPATPPGAHDGTLERFAQEIGITLNNLRAYRFTAIQWPPETRVSGQTFTNHKLLAGRDDRFEIMAEQQWTRNALCERIGYLPQATRTKPVEPKTRSWDEVNGDQVANITPSLSDPRVAEGVANSRSGQAMIRNAIKSNPQVAQVAMKALDERYDEAPKPIEKAETSGSKPIELVYEFRRLHRAVDGIIGLVIEGKAIVSDTERDAVLREVEWLRTALGYIEAGVSANSLEKELVDFLGAES